MSNSSLLRTDTKCSGEKVVEKRYKKYFPKDFFLSEEDNQVDVCDQELIGGYQSTFKRYNARK